MEYLFLLPLLFVFLIAGYLFIELIVRRIKDRRCKVCGKDIRKENSMIRINDERHCLVCWEELVKHNDYFDNNNWMLSVHEQMALKGKNERSTG